MEKFPSFEEPKNKEEEQETLPQRPKVSKFKKRFLAGALLGLSALGGGLAQGAEIKQEGKEGTKVETKESEHSLFEFTNLLKETRQYMLDRTIADKEVESQKEFNKLNEDYGLFAIEFAQKFVAEEIIIKSNPESEQSKKIKEKHQFIESIFKSGEFSGVLLNDVDLKTTEVKMGRGYTVEDLEIDGKKVNTLMTFGYGRIPENYREKEGLAGYTLAQEAAVVSQDLVNLEIKKLITDQGFAGKNDFSFELTIKNKNVEDGQGTYNIRALGNHK